MSLNLRVRYFRDSTPEGILCLEKNFILREIQMVTNCFSIGGFMGLPLYRKLD